MNKIFSRILITIAFLSLTGCGIYKEYEREEMQFVDSLYRRMSPRAEGYSTGNISWESMFTDPLLQEWIQTGLDYNTDLHVARLKVQEAEAALLAARWALLPGADFNMQGGLRASSPQASEPAGRLTYSAACATPNAAPRQLWNRARHTSRRCRPSSSRQLPRAITLS